ncbi:MAG: ATP cone domain-containing protein, partial [Planctomycetota bacterium]|nr:ATP cone domain-containing protein [Planctomycetota bacterium]
MSPIRQVRKRDGRLVPFDRDKVAEAIFRAAQAVGGADRFLAEELAGVVVARLHALQAERGPGMPPSIEDVQDLVERVLIDSGHARTAKAYILYRDRRAEARAARAAPDPAEGEGLPPALVGDELGVWRFSKALLVDRLVEGEALTRAEAEELARAVEVRVLKSAAPRLSPGLLDTLVRAELFERGWLRHALRPRAPALPERLVRSALEQGPDDRLGHDPATLTESIGEAVFARHVLEPALPPAVAEAHRVGDIHIHDLGAPLRLASMALSAPEAAAAELGGEHFSRAGGARRAFAALESLLLRH